MDGVCIEAGVTFPWWFGKQNDDEPHANHWRVAAARPATERATTATSAPPDDRALSAGIQQGDVNAFTDAFRLYYPRVVQFLMRYLHAREAAEDVAQDTFVKVWERRQAVQPDRSLRGFLYTLARHQALHVIEHNAVIGRHVEQTLQELGATAEASPAPDPHAAFEAGEIARLAASRVATLSPRLREVYQLSRGEQLSPAEIAQVLGTSVYTVHKQLAKVIEALSPVLRRWTDE